MAIGVGQRCVVRIHITDINLRNAREIMATIVSPQGDEKCQEVSFDEVSGLVYATADVNSAGNWSMWLCVRFANEVVYTPSFVFADVSGDIKPCDVPYVVDVEVQGESVTVTPPKVDVDAVTREEFERLSKDVAGKVDRSVFEDFEGETAKTIVSINQDIESISQDVEAKANKKGYYKNLSVGMADNLIGRGDVQDAQINFRPSAGDANITDHAARIERIKGNSVVWNQLIKSDSTSIQLVAKRTYFTDINGEHSVRIISATTTIEAQYGRDKVVDLTKMFGTGNEPTSYEEYLQRKPMNIDEFAYNAGTLIDMHANKIISTSDNAYDYTKGYARVMGGQTYDCSYGTAFVEKVYFSTDKDNIVAEENAMTSENGKYVFPSDGYVVPYTTDGDVREYCVCLQHSYTKPHPAYQQEVKDLSFISEAFQEGMRCIPPFKDDNGVIVISEYIFDEIRYNVTTKKWEAVKRIGEVDLSNLSWGASSITGYTGSFRAVFAGAKNYALFSPMYVPQFKSNQNTAWVSEKQPFRANIHNGYIGINNPNYTDVASFKQDMQGVKLYYELAEPIITEIEGSENWNLDYMAWDFGTEEAIVPNNVPSAPFRADINYEPNAVDDLRWAVSEIRNLKAQIAQMQTSVTNLTE